MDQTSRGHVLIVLKSSQKSTRPTKEEKLKKQNTKTGERTSTLFKNSLDRKLANDTLEKRNDFMAQIASHNSD